MLLLEGQGQKPPATSTITESIATRYIVAVLGSWCAEFATYPFDLAKTRLQIQNEVAAAKHGFKMEHYSMISTIIGIARNEGPLKIWSGLLPMCQRHLIYSGCRLIFYERMRKVFVDEKGKMSLGFSILCGMTCGSMAQLIASPADLVKVQMQAEGRAILQGKPRRFKGCLDVYRMIYRDSGIAGFWRGAVPNMQRAAMVNIGDLTAYDYSKRFLIGHFEMKDGPLLHTLAALSSGVVGALLGTPAEVMKTRIMNQPVGPDGKGTMYTGIFDCFRQSVGNEGFFSLYKGFVPMWIRLGPWALVNWVAFEQIMSFIGGRAF